MWNCENVKLPGTSMQSVAACLLLAVSANCAFAEYDLGEMRPIDIYDTAAPS